MGGALLHERAAGLTASRYSYSDSVNRAALSRRNDFAARNQLSTDVARMWTTPMKPGAYSCTGRVTLIIFSVTETRRKLQAR